MIYDFHNIATLAKSRFQLNRKGVHGVAHWQRVQENGLKIAKRNGANTDIIRLFSFLHDCCRESDSSDPDHGPRAAQFTRDLWKEHISGEVDLFEKLLIAIRDHTSVIHCNDLDIATCWDADRLDIGRVGMKPQKQYLNTVVAKHDKFISWAYKRSKR